MKLTSRLNAAVDDLIQMGQKYKKRVDHVAKQLENSHINSSVFDSASISSMPNSIKKIQVYDDK